MNRTTTALTVAATVVTVEKTMCVTLRMGIVPRDVNNIGLDQSVMVGKEYLEGKITCLNELICNVLYNII